MTTTQLTSLADAHIARLADVVIRSGRKDLPISIRVHLAHGRLWSALALAVAARVQRIELEQAATTTDLPAQN